MSIKAADYYGHCQACDRLQKLPQGMLAKHGYEVVDRGNSGFFSGACRASAKLPYEQDCSYIADVIIPHAKDEEDRLVKFVAKLRVHPTEPKAYHQVWTRIGGIWKICPLSIPEHGDYPVIDTAIGEEARFESVFRFSWLPNTKDLLGLAAAMNEYYAKHVENYDLRKIRRYRQWQEKRVADWQLLPLPPVDLAKELKKKSEKEFTKREIAFVSETGEAA